MQGVGLDRIARMLSNHSHPADLRAVNAMRGRAREHGLASLHQWLGEQVQPTNEKTFIVCPSCKSPFVPPSPLRAFGALEGGPIDGPAIVELVDTMMAGTPCPFCDTIIK